jgi:hypothetical protein
MNSIVCVGDELVKLVHFYIIEPQRLIGGLIFFGGRIEHDIEHCHFVSYFLPNLQLNIGFPNF